MKNPSSSSSPTNPAGGQGPQGKWIQFPSDAPVDCLNWIEDQWIKPKGATGAVLTSPYTGRPLSRVFASSGAELDRAVLAAKKAAPQWARASFKERSALLYRFREILLRDLDSMSHGIAAESGKLHSEARAGLLKGVEVLEYALSVQNLDTGARLEVSRGVQCESKREALGVVAGITPFNFPAMVPMWMIPIALIAGNAFIWKPSDKTPLTSLRIAEALKEAGLPSGLFAVLQGGRETVEAILDHPGISAVGFVGSSPIARAVYTRGTLSGKRVLALGGAKNHLILMPDADLEMSARGITDSYTGCAGQRCMAASVLLAVGQEKSTQAIIDAVVEKSKAIRLGIEMGALITRESKLRIEAAIRQSEQEGAKVLLDGSNPQAPEVYGDGGHWLAPTLIDSVKAGSQAACTELFGPVLSILRVDNLTQALKIQNDSPYGNACSVFTSSGAVAERVAVEAHAGMIGINIGVPVPREPFSFGGIGESRFGQGDITGEEGLAFWTQLKKVTTKWAPTLDKNWMN
jgi:malonate-semialdehyde dehydrogenase (acetylating)/methylmalonate-semialdehyde dehydrogenase